MLFVAIIICDNRNVMHMALNFVTLLVVLASALSGHGFIQSNLLKIDPASASASVEIGLDRDTSQPLQKKSATVSTTDCDSLSSSQNSSPACTPEPTITSNYSIVRSGYPIVLSWDPRGNAHCVLSSNLLNLKPTPNGGAVGSIHDAPIVETSYSIVCDGTGKQDSTTVNILPNVAQ